MNPGTDWIEQGRRLLQALSSGQEAAPADADGTEHSSDCRWCPICQAAAVVRGERPEVTAALADLLTTAAAALRTLAAGAAGDAQVADDAAEPEDGDRPAVQQIEIA